MTSALASTFGRTLILVTLAGMLASCTALGLEGGTTERMRLERQKARWVDQHLSSYRFTYSVACFCAQSEVPIVIDVRGNVVAEATYAATGEPAPLEVRNALPTIDALFRAIERAIVERADLLEVTYHPVMGYPTRIAIDQAFNATDEGTVHSVSALAPIDED
jgi:hypothetical protein